MLVGVDKAVQYPNPNMELKKDLLAIEKKSIFRMLLGVLFLLIAGHRPIFIIFENAKITTFDWVYIWVFALNGVLHIVEGYGYSLTKLFGRAFIVINNELISAKTKINREEVTVYWKDIKCIDFSYSKLVSVKADNTKLNIAIGDLTYDTKKAMKVSIAQIMEDKKITCTAQ
jgi:hypothetical protein